MSTRLQTTGYRRIWASLAVVTAVTTGAVLWQPWAGGQDSARRATDDESIGHAKALSRAFRNAAQSTLPTVVTVRSKTRAQTVRSERGRSGDPFGRANPFKGTPFEDLFDEFHGQPEMPRGPQMGMGSGVIVDRSGIVVTNNHVVAGADEVVVQLADGREFKADDIKTDEQSDLAVLRIKGAGSLPAARWGDANQMEIGDWVIAIGNPFELEQTVSAGIISGKGRELGSIRRAQFLQTDAAINPGNSGGPLVNLDGEVIGINTAIASDNGSFQGIGFAIPSNQAQWVVSQLIDKGAVERAYLGVAIGEVTNGLADKFGVGKGQGVLVNEVFPNTPAADAGLKEGDVITKFAGHAVHSPRELQEHVERVPMDSHQKIDVMRDGKSLTIDVAVQAMPKEFGVVAGRPRPRTAPDAPATVSEQELGIEVADVSAEQSESMGYKGFDGVVIAAVEPDSIATEAGLRRGMLIMKVGRKAVTNVDEFQQAMSGESLADGVLLQVRTPNGNRFVTLSKRK